MCWFCCTQRSVAQAEGTVELKRGAVPFVEADVLTIPRCQSCRRRWNQLWVIQGALLLLSSGLTVVWFASFRLLEELPVAWFVAAPIVAVLMYLGGRHMVLGVTQRIDTRMHAYPAVAAAKSDGWKPDLMDFWN